MPALLSFSHFFLIIFSYYIIKPVRDALFVKSIGPDLLPYFYLAVAGITFVVVAGYNALQRRFDSRRLVLALQVFVTLNMATFWLLMRSGSISLAASFYVWASIYNVLLVTVFWSLTNDLFSPQEGRRSYGLIGGGGILGGIAGSATASTLPLRIGTIDCLAVATAIMVLAVIVTIARLRIAAHDNSMSSARGPDEGGTPERAPKEDSSSSLGPDSSLGRDISLLFSNHRVLLIAKIVFFATLGKTIFNFHYYKLVDAAIVGTDETTAFFGMTYTATNISSALLQFGVTTWFLRAFGAKWGLLFTPSILLAAMVMLVFPPVLLVAAAFNVGQQSTSYSINQSAKELLYTPCSQAIKYRTKAVIDMFVYRFGDAFASLVLLALHAYLRLPAFASLAVGGVGAAYWLAAILRSDDPTHAIASPAPHTVS